MNIGEKIKSLRKEKKLTQSALAGQRITRNMLSLIERGAANPSLETVEYIAAKLGAPLAYFFSDSDNLFFFEKEKSIKRIREAYAAKSYKHCIELCDRLSDVDDELAYILSICHFELGKREVLKGSFSTADKHLRLFDKYSILTRYDLRSYVNAKNMYACIISNIHAPLLEFDPDGFYVTNDLTTDFEFYKYFIHDYDYPFKDQTFAKHAKAKRDISERAYREAIATLLEIESDKNPKNYNTYVMFGVYSDLEQCYKLLFDFENAYRYASKKLSLIEGFKT
jgi:transcriptional regulator with XRE-family HTH domain